MAGSKGGDGLSATAVEVTERPILFSAPMVRAILDGRKTQTRRVIKDGPKGDYWSKPSCSGYPGDPWYVTANLTPPSTHVFKTCPYGKAGDRLWVRETWTPSVEEDGQTVVKTEPPLYRAGNPVFAEGGPEDWRWTPSIFMPRWASRITLEITDVRVERLQEISVTDIRSEGISCPEHDFDSGFCSSECAALRRAWSMGWDKINGKRKGCDWNSNPWVWVIEFKKL